MTVEAVEDAADTVVSEERVLLKKFPVLEPRPLRPEPKPLEGRRGEAGGENP